MTGRLSLQKGVIQVNHDKSISCENEKLNVLVNMLLAKGYDKATILQRMDGVISSKEIKFQTYPFEWTTFHFIETNSYLMIAVPQWEWTLEVKKMDVACLSADLAWEKELDWQDQLEQKILRALASQTKGSSVYAQELAFEISEYLWLSCYL